MLFFVNLNSDEGTVNAVREPEPTHDMRKDSGRGRRTVNRTMNDVRIGRVLAHSARIYLSIYKASFFFRLYLA